MREFILKYWLQVIFGAAVTALSGAYAWLLRRLGRYKIIESALLAILHDRLYQTCSYYLERGYAGSEDKRNLEYLYTPYAALGGNGTCKSLYEQCLALPLSKKP
jgi:hypothetical protein